MNLPNLQKISAQILSREVPPYKRWLFGKIDFGEKLIAQAFKHLESAIGHEELLNEKSNAFGEKQTYKKERYEHEGCMVFLDENIIKGGLHQISGSSCAEGHDSKSAKRSKNMELMG